jgi:AbrB family looped-hinge helix DNA binding protein
MTSKGPVTITANLRESLGLKPGDRVLMMLQDDGTLRLRRLRPPEEFFGSMKAEGVDVALQWRELEESAQEELARSAARRGVRESEE